jgi:hypothetical protein
MERVRKTRKSKEMLRVRKMTKYWGYCGMWEKIGIYWAYNLCFRFCKMLEEVET